MSWFDIFILAIVEGITEFLPISSTGHLIITNRILGLDESNPIISSFDIFVQAGAIAAVIVYYWDLLKNHVINLIKKDQQSIDFFLKIFVAFLPAVVIGLGIHDIIKEHLFGIIPVIIALIIGGIVILIFDKRLNSKSNSELTYKKALIIGLFQCVAMWPGTSRSLATILGGRFMKLSHVKAAEFSFLLAIPTLMGASALDFYKNYNLIVSSNGILLKFIVGALIAFVIAFFSIKFLLNYLKTKDLIIFGHYRIALGVIIAAAIYFNFL